MRARLRLRASATVLAAALLVALAPGTVTAPELRARASTVTCEPLGLRQRAAQTVMTAVPGTRMSAHTRRLVAGNAGAVLLLGDNVRSARQLHRFTTAMRRAAERRLLVAVDEEGGRVARLGEKGIVDHLPSARRLAQTRTPRQVRHLGLRLGRQLRQVGIDWNLAPVLDVTAASDSSVIGDRSYGGTARTVARYGRAFANGLRAGGVLTAGKHFPGHGRTSTDSHESLPTVTASISQLRRRDIRPFREALPTLDAVMSAHVRYPALDRHRPASLSSAVTRLLRQDLGYRGLLVTDDLEMGAITERWTVPAAAEMALRAGADVVVVSGWWHAGDVVGRLRRAVIDGRIPRHRLDRAVSRVLEAKGYTPGKIACLTG